MEVSNCIVAISVVGIISMLMLEKFFDTFKKNQNKKGETLSVKYPKLSIVLGVFSILFVGSLAYIFYGIAIVAINNFFTWLAGLSSQLDAVVIVAMISGVISIIGVVISSVVSKIIDYKKKREEYLSQKREVPYGEFIEMVYRITAKPANNEIYSEDDFIQDISQISKQLILWGSPQVVEKWLEFRKINRSEQKGQLLHDDLLSVESIMNQMRKDLGVKEVKQEQLLGFINDIKSVFNLARGNRKIE
ncbi:MAG: hypothetical protein KBC30_10870 [Planctomycetes bacterium]|nr:hypothetical protein [Planctomycetota bacterium]HPY74997.1 hypothetical protein [Planctomycetota bacterium]